METEASPEASPEAGQASEGRVTRGMFFHSLLRDGPTLFSMVFLFLLLFAALIGAEIWPHDAYDQSLRMRNQPPMTPSEDGSGLGHILGTDPLGRDIAGRLMHGARVSLLVGVSGVLLSGLFGSTLGVLAGYFRGRLDDVIMRLVDLQASFPGLLLALALLFVLGPGFFNLVLVLALTRWMIYARVARSMTLAYRESGFVDAAIVSGNRGGRIIRKHIVPNLKTSLLVLGTLEIAAMILAESGLSFLGFGVQPPTPSWGLMVASGRDYLGSAWWLATLPGIAILLTALSLNLFANALGSLTDPVRRSVWLISSSKKRANK
jgi:peptide/nickel transport system permease protein